jgi:AsmA-like protein
MTRSSPRRSRSTIVWWFAGIGLLILVAAAIATRIWADDLIARRLRPATIRLLEQRFESRVELDRLQVRVFPTLAIEGRGLVLRHRERPDLPALITIERFTIESTVRELWSRHIDRVRVDELHITIPPRRRQDMPGISKSASGGDDPDVFIHELIADNGLLTITSKREGKDPREFRLAHLRFENLQFDQATSFEAELSNPVPEGIIRTVGTFGPWAREEPSLTPLAGNFRFAADLGTIDGIGGALDAEGWFNGPLERIQTEGRTRTRDFHLSTGGATFPLIVNYKAIVDGTSGDTILDSVEADLAESHISASGEIVKVKGVKGRRITLDTRARHGRLEDFIRLTTRVKSSPMVGRVDLNAKLDIPPGAGEVLDRMDLAGAFTVASAKFTSKAIQDRVDELSRRGLGRPADPSVDDVASNMRGTFRLSTGVLAVKSLSFQVEGAQVRLAGLYNVRRETLDFEGELRLQAKVSQTQTGWKSIVLKVFDPIFRRDGAGTVLPITITGTKDAPRFGADIKKAVFGTKH